MSNKKPPASGGHQPGSTTILPRLTFSLSFDTLNSTFKEDTTINVEIEVRVFTRHDNSANPDPLAHPIEIDIYRKAKEVVVFTRADVWDAFDDIKLAAAKVVERNLNQDELLDRLAAKVELKRTND